MNAGTRRGPIFYASLTIATIAVGLLVNRHGLGLGGRTRDALGDALWAMMMFWALSAVLQSARRTTRFALALVICFAVEFSQLYHTTALDRVRETLAGRLVLGSGFDARDLVAYTLGAVIAAGLDHLMTSKR
jgi:hypothetical protein